MLLARGGRAVACDEMAALEIAGNEYRVMSTHEGAGAVLLHRTDGRVETRPLPISKEYRPLAELTERNRQDSA